MVRLNPLTIKLLRDLWRLRAQAVAIALVIAAGVAMVIMSFGMIRSLEATRSAYYDRYRFADVFAPVRRAPSSVIAQVRGVRGVAFAEGRVSTGGIRDVPGIAETRAGRNVASPRLGAGRTTGRRRAPTASISWYCAADASPMATAQMKPSSTKRSPRLRDLSWARPSRRRCMVNAFACGSPAPCFRLNMFTRSPRARFSRTIAGTGSSG